MSLQDSLKKWIMKHEGYRQFVYNDTVGVKTVAYGRNLESVGISQDEAELMLDNDIRRFQSELHHYSWYRNQPPGVRSALVNMAFNMGINRLVCFSKMIAALNRNDYTTAAKEALDSLWATQVGQRAKDVALMIREGK